MHNSFSKPGKNTMPNQYDFSKGKHGPVIVSTGKTRITIMLDNDVIGFFRAKAEAQGTGYQTLLNSTLRDSMRPSYVCKENEKPLTAAMLRKILREELNR
ncbi:BrnA antitoxin family protein [Rugamonas sp. A1-17]|nr:BrnA antitoxin family protein [Rugamonas sp. A1-17]